MLHDHGELKNLLDGWSLLVVHNQHGLDQVSHLLRVLVGDGIVFASQDLIVQILYALGLKNIEWSL